MRLVALITALLLAGCTQGQKGLLDTVDLAVFGDKDITVSDQQIQALPYASAYLRINNGQRIVVVLGYIEQGESQWLSQDRAMLVTRQGRLLKTLNLPVNLTEVTDSDHDPLRAPGSLKNGQQWSRIIRWTEEGHPLSSQLTSTFTRAERDESLVIAGQTIPCQVWYEDVVSQTPARQWRNTFWVDTHSGTVRQSQQMTGADVIPIDMTMLKPAP